MSGRDFLQKLVGDCDVWRTMVFGNQTDPSPRNIQESNIIKVKYNNKNLHIRTQPATKSDKTTK